MTSNKLHSLLIAIGATNVSRGSDRVTCSCLLASWTHPKGRDNTPSMVVFPEGRYGDPIYSCQSCHESGPLRDLVLLLWHKTGINMMHVIEAIDGEYEEPLISASSSGLVEVKNPFLREKTVKFQQFIHAGGGYEVYRRKRQETNTPWSDKYAVAASDEVPEVPWKEYAPFVTERVHPYLEGRGITQESWEEWELGVDPKMRRVLFPMRDHKGRLVAISGRLYDSVNCRCGGKFIKLVTGKQICGRCGKKPPPKYLHSKGFKRNVFLYGEHMLPNDDGNKLYVVEGHLDALVLWQDGFRPVVATLGTKLGEGQVERMVHYSGIPGKPIRTILVVHDGDEAGYGMGVRLKQLVAQRVPVFSRPCPDKSDPASMSFEERLELLGKPN